VLTNLTLNHEHSFLLNASTDKGERNSSLYSWFIGEHLLMKKNGISSISFLLTPFKRDSLAIILTAHPNDFVFTE